MDNKQIAKRLCWIIGAGFCLIALLKLVFLLDASRAPNLGTGHTEPFLFAPSISRSWSYVTETQLMILGVTISAVLLLAGAMFIFDWRGRFMRRQEPRANAPLKKSAHPKTETAGREFGKR